MHLISDLTENDLEVENRRLKDRNEQIGTCRHFFSLNRRSYDYNPHLIPLYIIF